MIFSLKTLKNYITRCDFWSCRHFGDRLWSLYSLACFMINKIRKNGCDKFGERKAYPYAYCTEKSTENESSWNYDYYISKKRNPQ